MRKQQGLTLRDLEELSGIPYVRINMYERELSEPGIIVALKLAHALKIGVEELFTLPKESGFDICQLDQTVVRVKACEAESVECYKQLDAAKKALQDAKEASRDAQAALKYARLELARRQEAMKPSKSAEQPLVEIAMGATVGA